MLTKTWCALLLVTLVPVAAVAQGRREVSIVFNVDQRAFTCWFEGDPVLPQAQEPPPAVPPPTPACPFLNAHVFRDNVHFYRGQRISLRLVGARIIDSFTVDLKADDLVIPGIPVFGADVALPSLQSIEPGSRLVLASGVTDVAAPLDVVGTRLLPRIDKSSSTDYQKLLEQILDDATHNKLLPLLNGGVTQTVNRLNALLGPMGLLATTANSISTDVASHLDALTNLKATFCAATAPVATDDQFSGYLRTLLALKQVVERQKLLQAQVESSTLPAAATTLVSLKNAVDDADVQRALSYNVLSLGTFLTQLRQLILGADPATVIRGLKLSNPPRYVKADDSEPLFLASINSRQSQPPTMASLALLKENLAILNSFEPSLTTAVANLTAVRDARNALNAYLAPVAPAPGAPPPPQTLSAFNSLLNDISVRSIAAADAANCVARTMPLPQGLTVPLSDVWYSSKEVTLTLKRSNRFPLLTASSTLSSLPDPFGGAARPAAAAPAAAAPAAAAAATGASVAATAAGPVPAATKPAGADAAATPQKAAEAPASSGSDVLGTAKFRVHNLYHFQLAFGFMRSNTPDTRYTLVKETVKVNNLDVTNQFFVQSRDRDYRFLPTADILFYPYARDFFPQSSRYTTDSRSNWKKIGGLVGFSLTDPTKDFFFGGVYMADSGIGIKAGLHLGYADKLPEGVSLEVPLVTKSTIVEQKLEKGLFFGIEMNAGLFRDLVGTILKK